METHALGSANDIKELKGKRSVLYRGRGKVLAFLLPQPSAAPTQALAAPNAHQPVQQRPTGSTPSTNTPALQASTASNTTPTTTSPSTNHAMV